MSSLLKKFDLTLDQLSFEYISSCKDKVTLERIIKVLRSKEEGYYPDLLKHAENRLEVVAPKSKLLSKEAVIVKKEDISPAEWNGLLNDLKSWENDVKNEESLIKSFATQDGASSLPPIRTKKPLMESHTPVVKKEAQKTEKKAKVKSYDDWNRLDVDEELAKLDIKESLEEEEENRRKRDLEKIEAAERARESGNECFKCENYAKALTHYNRSIQIKPSSAAYNNRAITHIKLKMYKAAIEDCCKVLNNEPGNVKALYRRSTAYAGLQDEDSLRSAVKDLIAVLKLEPGNKAAQREYNILRSRLNFCASIQATERLPVVFYGPSTSDFQVLPQSNYHYMWARSHTPTSHVPCRCNRAIAQENPLCRRCGEQNIQALRNKSKRKSSNRTLNASEIVRLCQENKSNLYVSPTKPSKSSKKPSASTPAASTSIIASLQPASAPAVVPNVPQPTAASTVVSNVLQPTAASAVVSNIPAFTAASTVVPTVPSSTVGSPVVTTVPSSTVALPVVTTVPSPTAASIAGSVVPKLTTSPSPDIFRSYHNGLQQRSQQQNLSKSIKTMEAPRLNEQTIQGNKDEKERELSARAAERGDASFTAKQYATALAYFSTSIKLYPHVDNLLSRASTYLVLGRPQEAVSDCTRVLQMEPNNKAALLKRAFAYSQMPAGQYHMKFLEDIEEVKRLGGKKQWLDEANSLLEAVANRGTKTPTISKDASSMLGMETAAPLQNGWRNAGKTCKDQTKDCHTQVVEPKNGGDGTVELASNTSQLTNGTAAESADNKTKKSKRKKKKTKTTTTDINGKQMTESKLICTSRVSEEAKESSVSVVNLCSDTESKHLIQKRNKRNRKRNNKNSGIYESDEVKNGNGSENTGSCASIDNQPDIAQLNCVKSQNNLKGI